MHLADVPEPRMGEIPTLVEPSNAEPAGKAGPRTSGKRQFYDPIVVGSGPAEAVA
jgi:hypothetical protein